MSYWRRPHTKVPSVDRAQARERFFRKRNSAAIRQNAHYHQANVDKKYARELNYYHTAPNTPEAPCGPPTRQFFSLVTERDMHMAYHHRNVLVETFGWMPGEAP